MCDKITMPNKMKNESNLEYKKSNIYIVWCLVSGNFVVKMC